MTYYNIFLVLILIVAILLILIIMVQNPKEGGLSSTFGGGAQNIGGIQSANAFLDKSTWTLAILMVGLILLANFTIPRKSESASKIEQTIENREIPAQETLPEVPTETPTNSPATENK